MDTAILLCGLALVLALTRRPAQRLHRTTRGENRRRAGCASVALMPLQVVIGLAAVAMAIELLWPGTLVEAVMGAMR